MPFIAADTTYVAPTRLVIATWGLPKVGKTTFGLTFPEPIYIYNFDYGYGPVISAAEGKNVFVADYILPDTFDLSAYKQVLTQFQKDWRQGVEEADAAGGSVIVDTASQLWEVIGQGLVNEVREDRQYRNQAEGKNAKDSRLDYRIANSFMDATLKRPLQTDHCNALYIQRAAPVYEGGQEMPGKFKMHGFKATDSIAETVLNMAATKEGGVMGRIDFSRWGGPAIRGTQIGNPTYEMVMAALS